MLKELKYICNVTEIYQLTLLLRQESYSVHQFKKVYYNDAKIIQSLESTLKLLNMINIVDEIDGKYFLNIPIKNEEELAMDIFKGIINLNEFKGFWIEKEYFIKIGIGYHVIRNFMINSGFIDKTNMQTIYKINNNLTGIIKLNHYPLSQKQLDQKLVNQKLLGNKAEEIILNYEKKRLNYKNGIKLVSEEDVTLGFDIISFNNEQDEHANRFIEVKAITNDIFYLSKNEIYKSSMLGSNYFLYLVNMNNINEPIIIENPYKKIFNNHNIKFEIESISYRVEDIEE
ncbi:DUF3883 domain-containing protein [Mammaliicoccus sciuri]|uniref:DUF3883 domain-containing protein n=1 Tax=Mammaliicoccus sciuri TaxID=1296 RepID=UPI001E2B90EB|nr:DUF3883 domain-containing protein [Mammaliicoccus sciuri]MCD8893712.1 DUF3883 domain-containing protein [Mammaliicoccus sciuri]MCD8911901.1 DUF3883 domain-containing protein [Mammaliicoccus sciuri]